MCLRPNNAFTCKDSRNSVDAIGDLGLVSACKNEGLDTPYTVVLEVVPVVVNDVAISTVVVLATVSTVLVMVTTVSRKVGALLTLIVMLRSIVRAVLAATYVLMKTGSMTMFSVIET